jgi:predicted esterase
MRETTEQNLRSAFAGESQAHMRYLIFSNMAEKGARHDPDLPRLRLHGRGRSARQMPPLRQKGTEFPEVLRLTNRGGRLKPDEAHGATFSITNPGAYGAILSTPIIHQPQAAILSTETITKMPVVVSAGGEDAIAIRSMMYLCLSYDHRIVDGAMAVQFLQRIRHNLEEFQFLP